MLDGTRSPPEQLPLSSHSVHSSLRSTSSNLVPAVVVHDELALQHIPLSKCARRSAQSTHHSGPQPQPWYLLRWSRSNRPAAHKLVVPLSPLIPQFHNLTLDACRGGHNELGLPAPCIYRCALVVALCLLIAKGHILKLGAGCSEHNELALQHNLVNVRLSFRSVHSSLRSTASNLVPAAVVTMKSPCSTTHVSMSVRHPIWSTSFVRVTSSNLVPAEVVTMNSPYGTTHVS